MQLCRRCAHLAAEKSPDPEMFSNGRVNRKYEPDRGKSIFHTLASSFGRRYLRRRIEYRALCFGYFFCGNLFRLQCRLVLPLHFSRCKHTHTHTNTNMYLRGPRRAIVNDVRVIRGEIFSTPVPSPAGAARER